MGRPCTVTLGPLRSVMPNRVHAAGMTDGREKTGDVHMVANIRVAHDDGAKRDDGPTHTDSNDVRNMMDGWGSKRCDAWLKVARRAAR